MPCRNTQEALLTTLYSDVDQGKCLLRGLAGVAVGVLVFFAAITLYGVFFVS